MLALPPEKLTCRRQVNLPTESNDMGDKSPKSLQKKSSQKSTKASNAADKQKAAVLSKQAAGAKR